MEISLDPRDALDKTLDLFGILGTDLAEISGVNAETISRYRRKRKDINSLNLMRLIHALPQEARFYFLSQIQANGGYKVAEEGGSYQVQVSE
jgi:transcriptional regulator with XRE-family HTH domain